MDQEATRRQLYKLVDEAIESMATIDRQVGFEVDFVHQSGLILLVRGRDSHNNATEAPWSHYNLPSPTTQLGLLAMTYEKAKARIFRQYMK